MVDDGPVTSTEETDRQAKIAALGDHLAEMEKVHGPVPQAELDAAERFVDGVEAALEASARNAAELLEAAEHHP